MFLVKETIMGGSLYNKIPLGRRSPFLSRKFAAFVAVAAGAGLLFLLLR